LAGISLLINWPRIRIENKEGALRSSGLILAFLGMIGIAGWSQQATPAAHAFQIDAKTPPITQYKPPSQAAPDQPAACPAKFESHPELDGIYKVGSGVTAPIPTYTVDAHMTDEARLAAKQNPGGHFQAFSLIGVVVDQAGSPQEICVRKVAGYGLDLEASKAVAKYRFRAASTDGMPVAVRLTIKVNFNAY
jgi:hypothetical protein